MSNRDYFTVILQENWGEDYFPVYGSYSRSEARQEIIDNEYNLNSTSVIVIKTKDDQRSINASIQSINDDVERTQAVIVQHA